MPKAKLLVVEDDSHLLLGLRDILELDDYKVLTAENGKQGLEILHREIDNPPDLIVSDIMMPYMDGIEFLRAVRQQDQWVTIPFIFLTAKGEKTDIQHGKVLGVDDYLIKPFDADDLLIAVESRLKRHRAINKVQASIVAGLKRNILTILNHEFRTPLTLVVAYADMLKDYNTEEMSPDQLLEFLRGVNSGADRLRRLIENFILLVEIETGDAGRTYEWRKHEITEPQEFVHILRQQLMATETNTHPINVEVKTPLSPIIGDQEYLLTALRELVDNAMKFSNPADPITITVCQKGMYLQLQVEDKGRGIPESELGKIWDSFYQINREMYEDQGSGAGLAIVQGITKLHGGYTDVESEVGKGSRFTISIPVHRK